MLQAVHGWSSTYERLVKSQKFFSSYLTQEDLSRLGRNYLQTGTLIEDFFPRHGVRYIAMNDGIDTMRDNNDIAPFKNILNEMYSKDISKKVHSSYLLKAQQGQFTGCVAPFGYRKDPEDKNHLLVDEETAPIVRQIFLWALEGHGPNFIRRRLEEQKVPCPTWWNRERGFRNVRTKWEKKDPENGRYMWDFSVIKDILMNPVYTGAIASQKKDYRFKIGTIGEKKPQDWIVVEERHEPLIDSKSFAIVQDKLKSRQRPRQDGETSLFAGLIKCGECGKSLTIRTTHAKHPQQIYACKTYGFEPKIRRTFPEYTRITGKRYLLSNTVTSMLELHRSRSVTGRKREGKIQKKRPILPKDGKSISGALRRSAYKPDWMMCIQKMRQSLS